MTVKVGVIGTGQIAEAAHIPAYNDNDHTKITCIADIDEARRIQVADDYGISKTYESGEELIKSGDIDIVSICTPPNTHENLFVQAAERGYDIYCEKPLAIDYESAKRMVQAASENSIITQVGYTKRYANNYRKVTSFIDNDLLGDIRSVTFYCLVYPPKSRWRYDLETAGGGIITENLPHWLDYFVDLFGEFPTVDRARLQHFNTSQVEDSAQITLGFGSTNLDINAKWVQPGITYKSLRKSVLVSDYGEIEFNEKILKGNIRGNGFYFKHGKSPSIEIGPLFQIWFGVSENVFQKPITDFIEHVVAGDSKTTTPVSWGAKLTKLREEIYTAGSDA